MSPAQAAALHRHIPCLVADARALVDRATADVHAAHPPDPPATCELIVDLAEVPPTPCWAELVLLVDLLRRALGPRVRIALVGVTPALAAPLIGAGVGEAAVVVDTRGRRWFGRPDHLLRPTGTWP